MSSGFAPPNWNLAKTTDWRRSAVTTSASHRTTRRTRRVYGSAPAAGGGHGLGDSPGDDDGDGLADGDGVGDGEGYGTPDDGPVTMSTYSRDAKSTAGRTWITLLRLGLAGSV